MNSFFSKNYFKNLVVLVVLTIFIEIFFYKVVFCDENFFWRDILAHSYPAKKIFSDAIQSGYFPLWNPFCGLGIPYLADLSNQPLYFFNLLFIFFQGNIATNLMEICHYILASFFTYLFVKNITSSRLIGILGGVIFALSGYCVSVSCNLEYLSPIAWIPALFWAYYKYLETAKKGYLILTATFLSLFIYVGDPMVYYFISWFLILHVIVNFSTKQGFIKSIKKLFQIFFLSIVFSSAQLIPGLELLLYSVRSSGLAFNEASTWSFNPFRLIEIYLPFFYGQNIPYPAYWGVFMHKGAFNVPWAESVYPGTLTTLFGVCSLFYNKSKEKLYWFIVFIVSLILAFGKYSPVYILLYHLLPGFSSFRYPEKLIIFTSFSIIILFCLLIKDISTNLALFSTKTKYYIAALILLTALVSKINFYSWVNIPSYKVSGILGESFFNENFMFKIFYFAFILLIFVLIVFIYKKYLKTNHLIASIIVISFLDLLFINSNAFMLSSKNFMNIQTPSTLFIKGDWKQKYYPRVYSSYYSSKANLAIQEYQSNNEYLKKNFYDILSLHWIDNLLPNRSILNNIAVFKSISSLSIKSIDQISEDYVFKEPQNFIHNFGIDYILASSLDLKDYINASQIVYRGKFNYLLKPKKPVYRAVMVYNALYYSDSQRISSYFLNHSFDVREQILLKGNQTNEFYKLDPENQVKILSYEDNIVTIEYKSNTEGYLLLLDAYYPGWKAFIDNKKVKVLLADNVFRAIKSPSGTHTVKFIFDPLTVKLGIAVTILGYLISFLLLFKSNKNSYTKMKSIK